MGKRDTSRDPGGLKPWLTRIRWFWTLIQSIPWLKRFVNRLLLESAIRAIPERPEPLCVQWDYPTWEGLTNRRWSSRHHPPATQEGLPDPQVLARDLFSREADGFIASPKSTLVFPYFAQWFVDGFLVGDRVDRRRNHSNHHIDLCQLYGHHPELTDLIREHQGGRLRSQQIDGKGEYPPYLYDDQGCLKPEYSQRRQSYKDFVDLGMHQILVEQEEGEVDPDLQKRRLIHTVALDDHGALPRQLVFNEIPRRERLLDWELKPDMKSPLRRAFAIANDRGNSTLAFTMMSALMLREHNRIAGKLDRKYGWDDERTFQTARLILMVILLKVVIEEYINHIAPYHFKFFVDPEKLFKPAPWKWQNWMTVEFQLLYRWHSMIPDALQLGDETITSLESLWNPGLIVDKGLAPMFHYASRQPAGQIGSRNTWKWLIDNAEVPSIQMGRLCRLARYNDYRQLCGLPRVTSFDQITEDEVIQRRLASHYSRVDNIEYFAGIFCEDVRPNAALGPLIGVMVAADAFSQALPNPVLQKRLWNVNTFSTIGWEIIHEETHTIDAILKRNTPELTSQERDRLSVTMTRHDWRRA